MEYFSADTITNLEAVIVNFVHNFISIYSGIKLRDMYFSGNSVMLGAHLPTNADETV